MIQQFKEELKRGVSRNLESTISLHMTNLEIELENISINVVNQIDEDSVMKIGLHLNHMLMIPSDKVFKNREINKNEVNVFKLIRIKGVHVFTDFLKLNEEVDFPHEFMSFFKDNHRLDSQDNLLNVNEVVVHVTSFRRLLHVDPSRR